MSDFEEGKMKDFSINYLIPTFIYAKFYKILNVMSSLPKLGRL